MSKSNERGSRDIEATAIRLLEENVVKTTHLLKNMVSDLTILVDDIDYIVGSIANPDYQADN